jgi:hypothetical protein
MQSSQNECPHCSVRIAWVDSGSDDVQSDDKQIGQFGRCVSESDLVATRPSDACGTFGASDACKSSCSARLSEELLDADDSLQEGRITVPS